MKTTSQEKDSSLSSRAVANQQHSGGLSLPAVPAQFLTPVQRKPRKKKRKDKAGQVLGLEGPGTFPIAHEGLQGSLKEERFENPRLFWRGDNREPAAVIKTGFTTKNERDNLIMEKANVIKWRSGNNQDDIDPDSGVCIAADIRGSAFFPLDKEAKYIYAVALTEVINTYAIQQMVEEHDTGLGEPQEDRYPYDPNEDHSDEQSAIWQFKEYVVHRIERNQIIACYKIERENYLVKGEGEKETSTIPGIKFKLEKYWEDPSLKKELRPLVDKADFVANEYKNWYPEGEHDYISYYGIIRDLNPGNRPETAEEARDKYDDGEIEQLSPLIGEAVEDRYDAMMAEKEQKQQRRKNRRQKKRKKFRGKR